MSRPVRVLQVEDNPDDAELVVSALRTGGFDPQVARVETAEEMRAALAGRSWDVVLSDYNLPTFSAIAALGVLHQSRLDLPFIVVTGTIGEDRAVELVRAGAHDFVLKDRLGRLAATIERALGDARARADRLQALELVRSTNHELATLVEASPLAIFVVGADGLVRTWNPAAERLFGRSRAEVIGHELTVADDSSEADFTAMRAEVQRGRTYTAVEMRWRRQDGTPIDIALSMAPLRGAETAAGFVGIVVDITERKQLEQMLLQSQKMEAIGLLAGGVAHDFNNLLAIILGYGEQMLARLPADDKRRKPMQAICQAGERASALTRQLLAFSRKQIMQPQVLDLNEAVQRIEGMLRRLIGEDLELRSQLTPGLSPVLCDPNQIEQVLMNLAVNARDAMPKGGKLTIATAMVEFDEAQARSHPDVPAGSYVILSVTDTGVGIDAATRQRIFEPFFTTKERGRGTGLGLSTVFGIVKQSSGYIRVESAPGHGASFIIYLPRAQAAASVQDATGLGPEHLYGTETILVVEDEESLRQLVCEQLREHGYTVMSAPHAEEAITCSRQHQGRIHLLLTDVILPGMSGFVLAQRLSALDAGLRILYMSGYTDDTILRHGVRATEVAFIEKPFRPQALLAKVRQVLADG